MANRILNGTIAGVIRARGHGRTVRVWREVNNSARLSYELVNLCLESLNSPKRLLIAGPRTAKAAKDRPGGGGTKVVRILVILIGRAVSGLCRPKITLFI